jgi:hypothetical protein
MTEEKKQIMIAVLIIWLLLVIFLMIVAQDISLEIFFVLWMIGLFVIVELIGPSFVQPSYLRYLKFLVAVSVMIFAVIIAQKLMEIFSI